MKSRRFIKQNTGFTLVEVIISIGFLCIACGIIIQLFIASGEVRATAALKESASLKAANAIEACRISNSPADVGRGLFNETATDYEKNDTGYIIREYFDADWLPPRSGESIVYVVRIELTETKRLTDTFNVFGSDDDDSYIISAIFDIHVVAEYVDMGIEDRIIAEFSTSKHYVFKGDGE